MDLLQYYPFCLMAASHYLIQFCLIINCNIQNLLCHMASILFWPHYFHLMFTHSLWLSTWCPSCLVIYSISQEICTRFLLCFVVVIHWLIVPYPSGLLHWHCGNLTIAPVPAKQPWWIWINTSCEFIMNDCITTTKQSTTKPCAYFLGYAV